MDRNPLIGVSIIAVVLLVLGSLTNVVGYQTVQSSRLLDPPPWPSEGIVGVNYSFCIQIPENPQGSQFWVLWDWGDGTNSSWLGPYNSGEIACASHAWYVIGVYGIKNKLKDSYGHETWSDTRIITIYGMTKFEMNYTSLYFGKLWFDIKNTGYDDAIRTNWSIAIDFILYPPSKPSYWNGTIQNLGIGQSERISTNGFIMSFGIRKITIKVNAFNAEEVTKIGRGLFLGPIIIIHLSL